MHFALEMVSGALVAYAKERGLAVYYPPDETDYQYDSDIDADSVDEPASPVAKTPLNGEAPVDQGDDRGRQPRSAEIDVGASMERGLQAMVEDTGAQVSMTLLRIAFGTQRSAVRQYSLIVSFYTNYHLGRDDVPKTREIEKMCAVLGTDRPPAWYVDGYKNTWVPFNRK